MVKDDIKVEKVKREIIDAFGDVPYPGDNKIVSDPLYCDECQDIAEAFRGKHWNELTLEFIFEKYRGGLYHLEPEGYRYYLPGYMILSLDYYYEGDSLVDSLIYSLTPPSPYGPDGKDDPSDRVDELTGLLPQKVIEEIKETSKYIKERYSYERKYKHFINNVQGFTDPQRNAIRSFLTYIFNEYPDDFERKKDALREYWKME
jgi:hypothetical protein